MSERLTRRAGGAARSREEAEAKDGRLLEGGSAFEGGGSLVVLAGGGDERLGAEVVEAEEDWLFRCGDSLCGDDAFGGDVGSTNASGGQ